MGRKTTVHIESNRTATAIVGYPKKEVPEVAKKVVKRQINKSRKNK